MISSLINTYWLTPEEQKHLCLSNDWELWQINKYSIQMNDQTCTKVRSLEKAIVGLNPKSGLIYQADFHETCWIKAVLLSIFNGFLTGCILLSEAINRLLGTGEKTFFEESLHVLWYAIGIQIACLEAVVFESVYGALTISCLELKANRDIPFSLSSSFPLRHDVEKFKTAREKNVVIYRAPCMQPLGHRDDLLDKGDHTPIDATLDNEEEYELFKKQNRYEFICKI